MTTELCNTIIIHGQPTERDRDFYNQGYEAGLRRAAEALKARDELAYRNIKDFAAQENVALDENEYLLGRGDEAHGAYRAILAEIKGE